MNDIPLPIKEFDFSFSRSGGPGGQNVNKVNSKVTLRWNIKKTRFFSPDVIKRFLDKYPQFIVEDGIVLISGQRFRGQARNIADCTQKLRSLLFSVLHPPKARRATKATASSREKRLRLKKGKGEIKKLRQKKQFSYD